MVACPNCGEENPERARFCWSCGAALAEPPAPAGEERKIVSVLFIDLVGFTGRSDRADPEDVRATIRPYHTRLRQEIERFGGTVEKFVGDAVMAVFGAPVAHEDDAERAVRAALRTLEAVEELGLEVRAAVNTGEAVVALGARPEEGEGIVTGDVVNTASRLQGVAPVGGVVVGEATYRATRDLFDYEPLEAVAVKGKSDALPIWRALAPKMRLGVDIEQAQTPFIGRGDELTTLETAFSRTLRDSSIQLVTLTGEPGVGKTRLLSEFRTWVDDRPELVYWRQGRCLPYGEGITYWALGEMVKAHAGILESDRPKEAVAKLDQALRDKEATEHDWLRARLSPLVGVAESSVEREESFAAWRAFLERVAEQRPLILVFEDLHWADEALLAFVEHLVDWSTGVPILVLCAARPELYERHSGWGGGKRNSTTISLSPLTGDETARLLAALLERAVLPAETQTALLERCGGNPLYAEEFARMLRDRGLLAGGDDEIPVPDSVQAVIAARLDTLRPERKALLHDAAVVGKVFWAGAVATMGGVDPAEVREGLHELARKELVRGARTSSVKDEAEYAFWHLLVRDVAYGQLPRVARARKHRAAAEWIEGMAGERVADHGELLAYHYEQALELARAAGEDDEARALEEPTRRFLVMAGERSRWLDVARAAAYYRRAADLSQGTERAEILLELGDLKEDLAASKRDLEEALGLFRAGGEKLREARALIDLGHMTWFRGDTLRAVELIENGIELAASYPPGPELVLGHVRLAGQLMLASRPRECLEASQRAIELAEQIGHDEYRLRGLGWRGVARGELGDIGALDDLREALEESKRAGRAEIAFFNNLADFTWELESPVRAVAIHEEAEEYCGRRGMRGRMMWSHAEKTWMLYDLGRWDDLIAAADEVAAYEQAEGRTQVGLLAGPMRGLVLIWRDAGDATPIVDEILPRARKALDPQVLVPALALRALATGDVESVVELEEFTRDRADWIRARFLVELGRLLVSTGHADLLRALVEPIEVSIGRTAICVVSARGLLAEDERRFEEALSLHEEAAQRWGEYGFVLGRGMARLGAGRCLIALERDGADRIQTAREIFDSLGAVPLIAEADELLGAEAAPARASGQPRR
jgi:class 3 adenylate cyclase/tetratricopeptide (TPR) repeat protein